MELGIPQNCFLISAACWVIKTVVFFFLGKNSSQFTLWVLFWHAAWRWRARHPCSNLGVWNTYNCTWGKQPVVLSWESPLSLDFEWKLFIQCSCCMLCPPQVQEREESCIFLMCGLGWLCSFLVKCAQCLAPVLWCTLVDLIDCCSAEAFSFSHRLRSSSGLTWLFWWFLTRF